MYTTTLDNGYDMMRVEITFDYQPYEPMTRHYPGSSEYVAVEEVRVIETNAELCLLPVAEQGYSEEILDWIHEEQEYAKYEHLMD